MKFKMSLKYYNKFEKEIEKRTKELKRAYQKGDIYKTICYLKFLTNLYYEINYKMTEDVFEDITKKVSNDLLGTTIIKPVNKNIVMFYDGFGLISRGLANIYIDALEKLGYDIVWVLYEQASDVLEIKEKYKERTNISFEIIPKLPILERMRYLQRIIENILPQHIFIYTTPSDVAGIGTISTIQGDATRYLIDLTDHAYWLGKCAVDYIIGFRNYGFNIAVKYRKIEEEKILILPYYPEKRDNTEFAGLPFNDKKHDFVFSGGSVYKIEGDNTYEEIVINILNTYPELYFVYAGNGYSSKLNSIKQLYPNRFFQIEERKDLEQILRRAKFCLGTYPLGGGLMTQYALQNNCIILQLCNDKGGMTDPTTYLLNPDDVNCVFYDKKDLIEEIKRIMNNLEYCNIKKEKLAGKVISEEDFRKQLGFVLSEHRTDYISYLEEINVDFFLKPYKERVSYERYCDIIYYSHNKWIWKKHPFIIYQKRKKEK